MKQYIKINTLYKRDPQDLKKIIEGDFRDETVKYLKDNTWVFTEKIDGTNIRIHWDGYNVSVGGRTDSAQIPKHLLDYLIQTFGSMEAEELFEELFGEKEVTLFGEGYGPKIQKGGLYREDVSFILFDILIDNIWLTREAVETIGSRFGIDVVPIILEGTIQQAVDFIKTQPKSTIGTANMEGVVGRPLVEVFDRLGNRVIVKIKVKDFC